MQNMTTGKYACFGNRFILTGWISEFVTVIFNRFLFTPYTESFDDPETRESFPVLDPITRHQLYELVRCLVQFDGEHGIAFLDLLMQLFPEGMHSCTILQ